VAILFRTRESHREFEQALERRGVPAYVYKGLGFFDADEIKDVVALLRYLAEPTSDLRAAAVLRSGFGCVSDEGLRRLAPGLARILSPSAAADAAPALDDGDTTALEIARRSMLRWCGLVDRMPPAELLDLVLDESAYSIRLRGPRMAYARENLKKIRAIIRRIQNRGYATMARIADHLDRLAVGDEPNAVIDALDAVSLMTIHAAKGLEFPIVFIVNAARGTGNRRDAIRIAGNATGDSISVAVGDYRSEADEDDAAREREETKRLLYVALTRARDRLYLSTSLKDGRVQPGRGSLAEVWPASLLDAFAGASAGVQRVDWTGPGGMSHRLRVVSRAEQTPGSRASDAESSRSIECDFESLVEVVPARTSVAASVNSSHDGGTALDGDGSDLLVGRLVHRLLQRFGMAADVDKDVLESTVERWLHAEAVAALAGRDVLCDALAWFETLRRHELVREEYQTGEVFHEVPFVFADDGQILRGAIDCLIRRRDGSILLLEFKTGRRRDEHVQQAEVYRRAVASVFPTDPIAVKVLYASDVAGF
jgi:ATP-dependent helicase/nuclease subunit A